MLTQVVSASGMPGGLLGAPLWLVVLVPAAIAAWSAVLAHKGIAVFHDGLRPLVPEFLAGRMTRRELSRNAMLLSVGFIAGFGLPLAIAGGVVMVYLLLLPADIIGTRASRSWRAAVIGGAWGGGVALLLRASLGVATVLPVNFVQPLEVMYLPVEAGIVAMPALAIGFQFGPVAGLVAVGFVAATHLAADINGGRIGPLDATSLSILAGMALLLGLAAWRDRRTRGERDEPVPGSDVEQVAHERRLRGNVAWLMVQGALISLACSLWIFGGSEVDFAFLAQGKFTQAAVADLMRGFAFLPLIVTSTRMTGVADSVPGLLLIYSVGFLSPSPAIAAGAGALVAALDVTMVGRLDRFFATHPSVRESAEHLRGAIAKTLEVTLLAGSIAAANVVLPGGLGITVAASLYVLNEVVGQRVFRLAAGPLAAIAVGLLASILTFLGSMPHVPM